MGPKKWHEEYTSIVPQQLPGQSTQIQKTNNALTAKSNGDDTNPPVTITTPPIEEKLVRDENMNELYMPPSFSIVLKRIEEMLYVPLDFRNGLEPWLTLELSLEVI